MTRAAVGGVNRGTWTPQEDMLLKKYIEANGVGSWSTLPQKAGLMRGGKSCRLRWMNHLRPNVKRGHISSEEEDLIIRLHNLLGNRWSLIAGRVPGRTDNDVKNYWNTHLRKKLATNDFAQCKTVKRIFEGHPLSCRDPKNIRAEDQKLNSRSKNQAKINTAVPDNFCFAPPTDSVAIPLHLRKEYSGDLSDSQLQDGTVKFDVTEASSSKFEKRDPAILEDDYKFGRDRVEKDESHERIAPSVIQMNELTEDMAEFLPITQFEQNVSTVFCSDSFISSRAGFDNLFWENDFIWEGLH